MSTFRFLRPTSIEEAWRPRPPEATITLATKFSGRSLDSSAAAEPGIPTRGNSRVNAVASAATQPTNVFFLVIMFLPPALSLCRA